MPIAIRAGQGLNKQGLNRRQWLVAPPQHAPCRSRQPRQTVPQSRRRSAAHHERHSIGRRLGGLRCDLGARDRQRGCRWKFCSGELQDHHWLGLRRRLAGRRFHFKGAGRWPAGRAGYFLSRAFEDIGGQGLVGETQLGISARRP